MASINHHTWLLYLSLAVAWVLPLTRTGVRRHVTLLPTVSLQAHVLIQVPEPSQVPPGTDCKSLWSLTLAIAEPGPPVVLTDQSKNKSKLRGWGSGSWCSSREGILHAQAWGVPCSVTLRRCSHTNSAFHPVTRPPGLQVLVWKQVHKTEAPSSATRPKKWGV